MGNGVKDKNELILSTHMSIVIHFVVDTKNKKCVIVFWHKNLINQNQSQNLVGSGSENIELFRKYHFFQPSFVTMIQSYIKCVKWFKFGVLEKSYFKHSYLGDVLH